MIKEHEAYCQPCVSPVWDTALVCHTLLEVGDERSVAQAMKGLAWLEPLQMLDIAGDWAARRPDVRPGGWAFQYANPHYPDLDDTAVVVMAMDRAARLKGDPKRFHQAIDAGPRMDRRPAEPRRRLGGLRRRQHHYYLNNIPFADHGALLDPPSPDLTARCLSMLAQLGETKENEPGGGCGARLPAPHPGAGRQLVRPLGH